MKNTPCEVIKDLLPLYVDDICSEKSKDIIEEHLVECEECRNYLDSLKGEIPPIDTEPDVAEIQEAETTFFKKVKHKMTIQKWIFCGTLLAIAFGLFVIYENPMGNAFLNKIPLLDKRVSVLDVEVSDVYQLENGYIYFTLNSKKPFSIQTYYPIRYKEEQNDYSESYDNGFNVISVKRSLWEEIFGGAVVKTQMSFAVPLSETFDGAVHNSSHLYYEGKDGEKITIWEEGEDLEGAPDWIERKVVDYSSQNNVTVFDDAKPGGYDYTFYKFYSDSYFSTGKKYLSN